MCSLPSISVSTHGVCATCKSSCSLSYKIYGQLIERATCARFLLLLLLLLWPLVTTVIMLHSINGLTIKECGFECAKNVNVKISYWDKHKYKYTIYTISKFKVLYLNCLPWLLKNISHFTTIAIYLFNRF